jgi:trk system potassium uptake protein TrkH
MRCIVLLAVASMNDFSLSDILKENETVFFEIVSATATVGLSMNVTPTLCTASKLIVILTMYIGRLGPLTIATMWVAAPRGVSRPEEEIPIG